jgi:hypothetical protein
VKIKTLYTCCEQVGRRGKDYETDKHDVLMKQIQAILVKYLTTYVRIEKNISHWSLKLHKSTTRYVFAKNA